MTRYPLSTQNLLVNGQSLTVCDAGQGHPVIFVHGSLGDYRAWSFVIRRVSKQFRAISYSRRYNFPNPNRTHLTEYSALLDAEDLIALMEKLGSNRYSVVGASFGATIVMIAATLKPEMFERVVLIEPALRSWLPDLPGGASLYKMFLEKAWLPARTLMQQGDMEACVRLLVNAFNGPGAWESYAQSVRKAMLDNSFEMALALEMEGNLTPISVAEAATLTMDCLLIRGENSPIGYRLISDGLAHLLPQSKLVTIPNARHTVWIDQPVIFLEHLMLFLQGH